MEENKQLNNRISYDCGEVSLRPKKSDSERGNSARSCGLYGSRSEQANQYREKAVADVFSWRFTQNYIYYYRLSLKQ